MASEDRNEPYPSDDIADAISTITKLTIGIDEFEYYQNQLSKTDHSYLAITLAILDNLK